MNVLFMLIQIKTLFRSIPEIRRINENQANFDEKLYALTRIEPIRHKESAMQDFL